MLFFGIFFPLAGTLRGSGDTRTPFYARFVGVFLFLLGFSFVAGIILGYGLPGVYAGLFLTHVCWADIGTAGFLWGDWADTTATMIAERSNASPNE
ncbi:hypothetical protein [Halobellus sp. GM3]|uniref:hypothetical protein n=1 Tax=Halobellus sp. GM3 TaxID=3458410 RepID=UPI00403E2D1D